MTTSTSQAREFLDFFCGDKQPVDYAVLIDAPWGSGKTYFIKNYLKARDEEAKKIDPLVGAPFLYASLYGVTSIEGVREQFFAQAHPVLNSKAVRTLGGGLLGVLDKVTGFKVRGLKLEDVVSKFEPGVLVFDDLERVAMPIGEALGMINTFVEHGSFKVIVIANQTALMERDDSGAYEKQREKVLGRTLSIAAEPAVVLDALLPAVRSDTARAALEKHRELALGIFRASGTNNLRSLRSAVADFDRLVSVVDPKLGASPEALSNLLAYLLAADIEYRAGLSKSGLERLFAVTLGSRATDSVSPDSVNAIQIRNKYPEVSWQDPIVPVEAMVTYLITGVIEKDQIDEAIGTHPLVVGPSQSPAWRRVLDWVFRGVAAFSSDKAELLAELEAGQVQEPGVILHVTGAALWIASKGGVLLPSPREFMIEYIDRVEEVGSLKPNAGLFKDDPFNDAWAGVMFVCREDPDFQAVREHLRGAVARRFDAAVSTQAKPLLERLKTSIEKGEQLEALYEEGLREGKYGGVPVLQHIDVASFADLYLRDGVINRSVNAALVKRYQYWGTSFELLQEQPWLRELQAELLARADSAGPPFTDMIKFSIDKTFAEMESAMQLLEQRASGQAA